MEQENTSSPVIEKVNEKAPWRLVPVEGIRCSECREPSVECKRECNYAACPYSNDGEW